MQIRAPLSLARWCRSSCICSLHTKKKRKEKKWLYKTRGDVPGFKWAIFLVWITLLLSLKTSNQNMWGSVVVRDCGGEVVLEEEMVSYLEVCQAESGVWWEIQITWEFHVAVLFPFLKDLSRNQTLSVDESHHSPSGTGSSISLLGVKISITTQSQVWIKNKKIKKNKWCSESLQLVQSEE